MSIRDSSKRKYWIKHYLNFANTYSLCYTETPAEAKHATDKGWEHITRQEAIQKCVSERRRRHDDPSFSGYADDVILPFSYDTDNDWRNEPRMVMNGNYVVEKRRG